jgi:hypothetical protein
VLDLAQRLVRFERRLSRVLRGGGLPLPEAQFEIFDEDGFVARPDFSYVDARLAIEADGYEYHGSRAAWIADLKRRSLLARAGWRVVHVTWADVRDRPEVVVDMIRRALEQTRALSAP